MKLDPCRGQVFIRSNIVYPEILRPADAWGMTYEQRQANIEKLKSKLSAFSEEWVVHFEFSSVSDFEIKYFRKKNWNGEMLLILDKHQEDRLPFGRMFVQEEHVYFIYCDSIYHFYFEDLTLGCVEDDYITSYRVFEYLFYPAIRKVPGFENFKITEDE